MNVNAISKIFSMHFTNKLIKKNKHFENLFPEIEKQT